MSDVFEGLVGRIPAFCRESVEKCNSLELLVLYLYRLSSRGISPIRCVLRINNCPKNLEN